MVQILILLCKEMVGSGLSQLDSLVACAVMIIKSVSFQSHKKAGMMWREAGLRWKDFLPEDEDVNKFVTEKVISDLSILSVVSVKVQRTEDSLKFKHLLH